MSSGEKPARASQADRMILLAQKHDIRLFRDQRGDAYIRVPMSEVYQTLKLRTKPVRVWLAGLLWKAEEKAPGSEALQSALNVLEAHANEGDTIPLFNRVAPDGLDGIYIDMCDDHWRAIHITKEGWKIVDYPPVLFRRYNHQKALPEPVRGGSIDDLLLFSNLKEPDDRFLFLVVVVSCFIPGIPHVVLVFYGPPGSGKTWSLRAARSVIDPSVLDILTLPRRQNELVQNLDHNYCAFYDNVGRIPEWISNILCRAVTGTGVSKRQLYTDDEDVIREFLRCCGLTDISIAAEKGDLLNRTVLLGLESIPKAERKTESELFSLLKEKSGSILGGILDILVKALKIHPTLNIRELYRMADFTKWGCAITQAMGLDPQLFIEAYQKNIKEQSLEAVKASPVAEVLINFMEAMEGHWTGTASQLFSHLQATAEQMKISTRQKAWPKGPKILMRRLNELTPNLPAVGYEITKERTGKSRLIIISVVNDVTDVTDDDDSDDTDNGDDNNTRCADCGRPLNAETGDIMDPKTGKHYCRQHWVARKRLEVS